MVDTGSSAKPVSNAFDGSKQAQRKFNFRLFERCSGGLLNLRFDSSVLESYYNRCSFPHSLFRFRVAVSYFALVCFAWLIFFIFAGAEQWISYVSGAAIGLVVAIILFSLTCSKILFENNFLIFYVFVSLFFSLLFLLPFVPAVVGVSSAFNSSIVVQLLLNIYINIPLRLWQVILMCGPVSVIHIVLSYTVGGTANPRLICIYVLMHCCVHLIGFLQHILSQVRRRSTFMRLGQSALMRLALEKEQRTQNEMIQSLMPQRVAEEVMKGSHEDDEDGDGGDEQGGASGGRSGNEVGYASSLEDQGGDGVNNNMAMKKISRRGRKKSSKTSKKKSSVSKKKKRSSVPPEDTFSVEDYEEYSTSDHHHETRRINDDADAELGGGHAPVSPPAMPLLSALSDGAVLPPVGGPPAAAGQTAPIGGGHAVHFRKFHVSQMENVSILFADIVGFTNMSSNKTASQLVFLLNDLFGRFDKLCEINLCEKIATLGDCYYCVSGCPNAVDDHAERIVEMGRSMCVAIQQFDEDHNEQVNMRVGVHTGKVICGLVGTRRFKFDVWSNDVTLANQMESSGKAGKVHISETTLEFVKDIYEVTDGEPVPDIRKVKVLIEYFNKEDQRYAIKHTQDQAVIKTYFIERRFDGKPIVVLERDGQSSHKSSGVSGVAVSAHAPPSTIIVTTAASNELTLTTTAGAGAVTGQASPLAAGADPTTEVKARGSDVEMLDALWSVSTPEDVFKFPPISPFSLCFLDSALESTYRRQVLRLPHPSSGLVTLASPRLTPIVNGLIDFIFYVAVCVMCFANFPSLYSAGVMLLFPFTIFIVGVVAHGIFLAVSLLDTLTWNGQFRVARHCIQRTFRRFFNWYIRNTYGALMLGSSALFILANFQLCLFRFNRSMDATVTSFRFLMGEYRMVYGLFFSFMLFNLTLFPSFSSWTKSLTAALISLMAGALVHYPPTGFALTCPEQVVSFALAHGINTTAATGSAWHHAAESALFPWEITVILALNLVLIFFLNRDIDISFRVSFNRDFEASKAKRDIAKEKKQGEWLLQNIIPRFVLTDLRNTSKYSEHVKDASVMFASIANFAEFYDEQYQGGQEMLRVLNEIFADFEHLLSSAKFKDVEKIKTIAECFMAASGLNLVQRARNKTPDAHIIALMDFAIELIKTLDEFNRQMFNFHFELKIGFNIGEVTAGVIGTTKLLYDIWGDTVNVASRMYSTGQKGRIQVTEEVAHRLGNHYDFEYRGDVFVKGKGEMRTYLLVGRK